MVDENSPKIQPSLEHVEQLVAVDQSQQDNRRPAQRRSKRPNRRGEIEQTLEEEQQPHHSRDDGHIDYRA
jgi:hypothetical protein